MPFAVEEEEEEEEAERGGLLVVGLLGCFRCRSLLGKLRIFGLGGGSDGLGCHFGLLEAAVAVVVDIFSIFFLCIVCMGNMQCLSSVVLIFEFFFLLWILNLTLLP